MLLFEFELVVIFPLFSPCSNLAICLASFLTSRYNFHMMDFMDSLFSVDYVLFFQFQFTDPQVREMHSLLPSSLSPNTM